MSFAKHHVINKNQFNISVRVSGRDNTRRVRRSKMKLGKSRISIPSARSATKIKNIIKNRLLQNHLYIGERIAPKVSITNKIDKDGKLTTSKCLIYRRNIPITTVNKEEIERFSIVGILRERSNSVHEAITTLRNIQEERNDPDTLKQLQEIENTFHMKIWHDHSEILNSSYVNSMVCFLYDTANFLNDEEYRKQFPEENPLDVQISFKKTKIIYILKIWY